MSIHTKHSPADCEVCAAQQEADAVGAVPTAGHSSHPQPQQQEGPELKPCPFCGGTIISLVVDKQAKYAVSCEGCDCIVGEGYDKHGEADNVFGNPERARRAWNLRADLPRATAEAELTVESALAELREMFPGQMVDVGLRVGPCAQYAVITVFAANFQRDAPTLDEAMEKVRAWSKSLGIGTSGVSFWR